MAQLCVGLQMKEPRMNRFASRTFISIALAVFALTAVSCKNPPEAHSPEVVVAQDATGATVVRLAGDDEDGKWELKDDEHDILVMRRESGFFDVNVSVTLPDGGIRRVSTQIKASPGPSACFRSVEPQSMRTPLGLRESSGTLAGSCWRITFTESG
jgi:hypothetical protein